MKRVKALVALGTALSLMLAPLAEVGVKAAEPAEHYNKFALSVESDTGYAKVEVRDDYQITFEAPKGATVNPAKATVAVAMKNVASMGVNGERNHKWEINTGSADRQIKLDTALSCVNDFEDATLSGTVDGVAYEYSFENTSTDALYQVVATPDAGVQKAWHAFAGHLEAGTSDVDDSNAVIKEGAYVWLGDEFLSVDADLPLDNLADGDKLESAIRKNLSLDTAYQESIGASMRLYVPAGTYLKVGNSYAELKDSAFVTVSGFDANFIKETGWLEQLRACETTDAMLQTAVLLFGDVIANVSGKDVEANIYFNVVKEDEVKATCTEEGHSAYVYSESSEEYLVKPKFYKPLGHEEEVVKGQAATCTEDGLTDGKVCSRCKITLEEQETIPATGHDLKVFNNIKPVAATMEADGRTAAGICRTCGESTKRQTIAKIEKVELKEASSVYSGEVVKPELIVEDSNGKALEAGVDYTVEIPEIKDAGLYQFTVKFQGDYAGDKELSYTVEPKKVTDAPKLSKDSYTYNKKTQRPTVSMPGYTEGTDYTVATPSASKYVGNYTVTLTFQGNYTGTTEATYQIVPKSTKLKSLTKGSKKIKVRWYKQSTQTSGYEIQYSTNKDFSDAKIATLTKNYTTSKTIKSLSAKKRYYVRIRTYKLVEGEKIYSAWSSYKYTTTK